MRSDGVRQSRRQVMSRRAPLSVQNVSRLLGGSRVAASVRASDLFCAANVEADTGNHRK